MFEFANPFWFFILPLPYLIYKFVPAYQTRQFAYRVPFFDVLVDVLGLKANKGATQLVATRWQRFMLLSGWLLLVIAMAKPMILAEPQTRELNGRDLMIILDLSGSMAEEDFITSDGTKLDRLTAAQNVLLELSNRHKTDRLGLVLFGSYAVLQSPFTADHKAWRELLLETEAAMVGETTHLGDAIGLAIKTYSEEKHKQDKEKVIIVLTDGNDTGSLVPPRDAARIAQANGIRIHMVAMGSPEPVNEGGDVVDMEVIKEIAATTGGKAFLAISPEQLSNVYQTISELEPEIFESFSYQPKTSIHHWPLILIAINYLSMITFYTLKRLFTERRLARGDVDNES